MRCIPTHKVTQLHHRGQAIERADLGDLRSLARNGLVTSEVVESEARRRREAFPQTKAIDPDQFRGDAATGGYLFCGHADCNRMVDAKLGSRCPEHMKAKPRAFLTPDYRSVDLNGGLADAEKRARGARLALEDAERDIKDLQKQIEDYDKAHADG